MPNAIAANAFQVDLTWSGANGTVLSYRLERSVDNGLTWPVTFNIPNPAQLGYSDTSVQPSTTYWYRVFAYNAAGDSLPSNTASITTPATPPAAPSNLVATASPAIPFPPTVSLTWTDNANNETGFRGERALEVNGVPGPYAVIATINTANTTSYLDATVVPKTTYWYRVQTFNGAGPSLYSNEARVVTPGQIPEAPANLRATRITKNSVSLAWDDSPITRRASTSSAAWTGRSGLSLHRLTNRIFPEGSTKLYRSAGACPPTADHLAAAANGFFYLV